MKSLYLLPLLLLFACGSDDDFPPISGSPDDRGEWLIPSSEVFDGGVGKDGIPSVDDPQFDQPSDLGYLSGNSLVVGVVENGVAKAYPHIILDWHEIVNDNIGDNNFAVTYCPLTGTAIGWDRDINGSTTTFGVSGRLYNTNLIPYDRVTDSYWSQLRLDCVNGSLLGTKIRTVPVIETTWSTWKASYPNSLLMNTDTNISRNYGMYPYEDYITNHSRMFFPVNNIDNRLPAKERVLTVIVEGTEDSATTRTTRAYSIESFDDFTLIEERVGDMDLIVIGDKTQNIMVAYETAGLTGFTSVEGELPVIAEDEAGNKITLAGDIIAGPRTGDKLIAPETIIGYFFAMAAFYPEIEIYR